MRTISHNLHIEPNAYKHKWVPHVFVIKSLLIAVLVNSKVELDQKLRNHNLEII